MTRPTCLTAALLPLMIGFAACGPASGPEQPAIRTGSDRLEAIADLLRIEDERLDDAAGLGGYLASSDPRIRTLAARAAGRLQAGDHRDALLALLVDGDTTVAATAAFALGRLAEETRTLAALESALDGGIGRHTVGMEAAAALGRIRTPAAVEVLDRWLAEADPSEASHRLTAKSALLAAWRFERPLDPGLVRRWLADSDPDLRWRAVYSLVRRPVPEAAHDLLPLQADPDLRVRALLARYLAQSTTAHLGAGHEAHAVLAGLARDPEPLVRMHAARALATHHSAADAPIFRDLLADPEVHVRAAAAEAAGSWGDLAAGPLLAGMLSSRTEHAAVRRTALEQLAGIDPSAAREWIDSWQHASGWRQRASAVRALVAAGEYGAAAAAEHDADPRVTTVLLRELARAEEGRPLLAGLRERAVRSTDPGLLAAAVEAHSVDPDPDAPERLLGVFRRAAARGSDRIMLEVVDAFHALAEAGHAAPEALLDLPSPWEAIVRLRAIERFGDAALDRWGDWRPVRTHRTADEYRRVATHLMEGGSALSPRAALETERGTVVFELDRDLAPLTTRNFLELAGSGFFDGQEWPRVVPGFVAQGGDPRGDTSGGPGYTIRDEINRERYLRGVIGMAHAGPETAGSQFFVTYFPQPHLDGDYTVFGRVISGMEVLEATLPGDRIVRVREITEREFQ